MLIILTGLIRDKGEMHMNMDEAMNFGKTIIGGADGPTAVFLAGKINTGLLVGMILAGLLFCFFGLKLTRLLAAIYGFLIGAAAGVVIVSVAGTSGTVSVVIILACALVLAALSAFLYKVGVFFLVFSAVISIAASLLGTAYGMSVFFGAGGSTMIIACAALGVALVLAILAVIYVEPVIVIVTALFGGLSAGSAILAVSGLNTASWMNYVLGGVLAVLGAGVQFMMHSRKVGRKEKIYSDGVKEKDSVESEVEKARAVLDEDDEEE